MGPERFQIRVPFQPVPGQYTAPLGPAFKRVERAVDLAQLRPCASGIVLRLGIVRIDPKCSFDPFDRLLPIAQHGGRRSGKLRGPGSFGMLAKCLFGPA